MYNNDEKSEKIKNGYEVEGLVFGRNAVLELIKSDRDIDKILIKSGEHDGSITLIAALAKNKGVPVVDTVKDKLDALTHGGVHQGVVAMVAAACYSSVEDILKAAEERGEPPFIVICDGVEDPHNFGAVIRCAEGAGAHGVIISKRHSAPLSAAAAKASAGALSHIKIAKVSNIASEIENLKKRGIWVYGAEADGNTVYETEMTGSVAVVVGSEGFGLSRLVREKCDYIVSIPMYGKVNSFNVSCAAAVILCEAARQRNKTK